MKQQIINYFKQYIYHPSALYKRIKNAPKQYIQYCQNILIQTPEWQKISYVIIGLCKNIKLSKCKSCGKLLTYHYTYINYSYCSDKCGKSNINTIKKRKQTNFKKYGTDDVLNSQERRLKTFKRTGYLNVSQKPQMKMKRFKISYQKFDLWKQYVIPLFSFQQFHGYSDKQIYKWKCVKCGNVFQSHIHCTKHISLNPQLRKIPRCLNCYPYIEGFGKSKQQKILVKFCKQYFPDLIENNRSLIKPLQLDIVIPQIKIAIEFNGNFYHSINRMPKNYHLKKTQLCQQKGYRLIHIWQDQWLDRQKQIKDKLIDIFFSREKITGNILDYSWYSILQFQNYQILQPQIIIRNTYKVENCGYLKIKK